MTTSLNDRRFVIAGGSGFLGISLASYLTQRKARVTILSRNQPKIHGPWNHIHWDARHLGDWRHALDPCDGLINFTGRSVDCIKSVEHCDEILRSRVESTFILGEAIRNNSQVPPVWIQMSTAHIYGDPPTARCTENSATGIGLAPDVGRAWETAFANSVLMEQRQVVLRTSFVLGRDRGAGGGALARLKLIAKLGLGGRIGSGQQGMSWIHESDLNRVVDEALGNPKMNGVYNVSSPNPLAQSEFMQCVRQVMNVPIGLPATEMMVRLGAHFILKTDPELALYGRFVLPEKLAAEGFTFEYPELREALVDVLK